MAQEMEQAVTTKGEHGQCWHDETSITCRWNQYVEWYTKKKNQFTVMITFN